jgi:hypothetical protein
VVSVKLRHTIALVQGGVNKPSSWGLGVGGLGIWGLGAPQYVSVNVIPSNKYTLGFGFLLSERLRQRLRSTTDG